MTKKQIISTQFKKDTKKNAKKAKRFVTKTRMAPFKWWDKQTKEATSGAKKTLSHTDVIAITLMAIAAALISAGTKVMIWMRWSTFPDNSYFFSWHPITPWIAIIGSLLYIYALYAKGVKFWLAYFPAFMSIAYCAVELAMIESWWHPSQLADFFRLFGLDNIPDWITGGKV